MKIYEISKTFADATDKKNQLNKGYWYGARHTQCILLFFFFVLAYGARANISVGIVAMTDPIGNPNKNIPTYNWNNSNVILSSFFWGYILSQIPAGYLGRTVGPRILLAFGMFTNSLFCWLIPSMSPFGSWAVILCRVVQGFALGVTYPMTYALLGKWAPLEERSKLGAIVFIGIPIGTVVCLAISGVISGSTLGWPYVFYLYGAVGACWSVTFFMFGSNSPAEHSTMDPIERNYIETSLMQVVEPQVSQTPWLAIFTSPPVWALIFVNAGDNWGVCTLLTNIPRFLKGVLNVDLEHNGLLSACPYITLVILGLLFSAISDYIVKNNIASIGLTRKVFNSIASYVPAASLFTLGQICSSQNVSGEAITVLLFVAVGASAGAGSGYFLNHIDLSPVHAGILVGLTNSIASVFSLLAPLALNWIVTDEENTLQWATAFYIAAGFYGFGNTVFVLFGSGEVQPWNLLQTDKDNKMIL